MHGIMARIDQDEVQKVQKFVNMLNEESENGAIVVVEGKRDVDALVSIGFSGYAQQFQGSKWSCR